MKASRALTLLLLTTIGLWTAVGNGWGQGDAPAEAVDVAGMTLATLAAEDLDAIQASMGRRLGVLVTQVRPGGLAAAAGIKVNDVLFAIGPTGVDAAPKAAAAFQGLTGTVEIVAATQNNGEWAAVQYKLELGAQPVQPAGGPAAGNQGQQTAGEADIDPVNAYFNMMDFVRSQAWGRKITTPPAERERVGQLLLANWQELGEQGQANILQLPAVWAAVQQQWNKANAQQRKDLARLWEKNLLTPNQFYPPPAQLQEYRSPNGEVALQYPAGWVGALQEFDGIPMLYLGPPGTETSWEKVLDAPNSPPGVLLALVQKDEQMSALPSFVAGARLLGQLLFKGALSSFKEINVIDLGDQGAVLTYLGKFPGQKEEKFYWIGAVPFGANAIVAGRLGGPTAQAETLVPALAHIIGSVKLSPPAPPGGGGVTGAWETAWSRVDVAITKQIWAPSGN